VASRLSALAVAGLLLCSTAAAAAGREESLDFGGLKRWWLVHEPIARASSGALPLVLVLHGGGGSPEGAERMSDMSALADREGFIAVYPAGTGFFRRRLLTWNSGNCCGSAMKSGVDDVGFLSALIEKYVKEGKADPKRVFMTGLSNGAMMTHRFACERADLIAAAAPVAGAIGIPRCEPSCPVSMLMIHGYADQHVPYAGGEGKKSLVPRTDRSAEENLNIWTKADGCKLRGIGDGPVDRWIDDCPAGIAVMLMPHHGGHVWPGGHPGARYGNVDPVVAEPKATETIWAFFKAHPRP
jgi:polyhydroxybutyrate depolymerase